MVRLLSQECAYLFTEEGGYPWSGISADLLTQQVLDEIFVSVQQGKSRGEIVSSLKTLCEYSTLKESIFEYRGGDQISRCREIGMLPDLIVDLMLQKNKFLNAPHYYLDKTISWVLKRATQEDVQRALEKFAFVGAELFKKDVQAFDRALSALETGIKNYKAEASIFSGKQVKGFEAGFREGKAYIEALLQGLKQYREGVPAYNIGAQYLKKNDYERALLFFCRIPLYDKNYAQAMVYCGSIELFRGNDAVAEDYFRRAGSDKFYEIGLAYCSYDDERRRKKAFEYLSKIPREHENYLDAMEECGAIQTALGNGELAAEYFQKTEEDELWEFSGAIYRVRNVESSATASSEKSSDYGSQSSYSPRMYKPAGEQGSANNNNNDVDYWASATADDHALGRR